MITIDNLKVKFGDQIALDIDKKIEINMGDKIGIIGSNGAGKSTLINAILGLVPHTGQIKANIKSEDIGVHLQFNEYVDSMPCKLVLETVLNTDIKNNKELKDLIDYFEMGNHLKKKYKHLSGGQKQRFTLIMVMFKNAKLTFFDEVTSGLDFESRQKLMQKLVEWYKGKDTAMCLVSHYYEELEQLADKILLLDKGRVVDFDYKEKLFHKYCGNTIYVLENTQKANEVLLAYKKLSAPDHLLAIPCNTIEEERALIELLTVNNLDYKRSTNDIEIMSINAKETFYKNGGNK